MQIYFTAIVLHMKGPRSLSHKLLYTFLPFHPHLYHLIEPLDLFLMTLLPFSHLAHEDEIIIFRFLCFYA
jgi:hypothetical protein